MTDTPAEAERFLAGRVIVRQSQTGYRASVDSVLLGCAVKAKAGERILELGCGAGTALLIAAWRTPQARFFGVEREPTMAALVRENIQTNAMDDRVEVMQGDALSPAPERREAFDHAFANPPFFDDPNAIRPPPDETRRAAFVTDEGGLDAWMSALLAAVPTRGRVTIIHRAERLADILAGLNRRAGDIRVRTIHPHADTPAKRVVVAARKGVRTPLTLLPPLVLHGVGGSLTAEAAGIIQRGEELSLGG